MDEHRVNGGRASRMVHATVCTHAIRPLSFDFASMGQDGTGWDMGRAGAARGCCSLERKPRCDKLRRRHCHLDRLMVSAPDGVPFYGVALGLTTGALFLTRTLRRLGRQQHGVCRMHLA